jgi:hypothetical protein
MSPLRGQDPCNAMTHWNCIERLPRKRKEDENSTDIRGFGAGAGRAGYPQEIVYGRDGFSNNNSKALEARIAGTSLARPDGMPLTVWSTIYHRGGFDFYASATERPTAVVNGMPAELWGAIASREGFAVYGASDLAGTSSGRLAARPEDMPADLWQLITGREGFDSFGANGTCAVC